MTPLPNAVERENERRMRRWFHVIWNDRREDEMEDFLHPDIVIHGLGDVPQGGAGYRRAYRGVLAMFADFRLEVEACHAQNDLTASRLRATFVYAGPGLDVPPTGVPCQAQVLTFTRWRDGRAVETWELVDMAAVYRQLGGRVVLASGGGT